MSMSIWDRLTVSVVFAIVAAFAFFTGCLAGHFAHPTVLAAAYTYGTWLVLTLASFFWFQAKSETGCVVAMFAAVATYAALMVCFAAHFTPMAERLSGAVFGGWFLLAASAIWWMMGNNNQRQFARCRR